MRVGGLAAFVLLSAACGVQPTAVVDAGAPPSRVADPSPEPVISQPGTSGNVYFIINDDQLAPVDRPSLLSRAEQENHDGDGTDLIALSLRELLAGPSADEVAIGLRSELLPQPSQTPLQVTLLGLYTVQLLMPMVTDDLPLFAAFQITCTVRAAAQTAGHPPTVVVQRRYQDGRVERLPACPIGPGS